MNNPLAKQRKTSSAIALSFDQFQFGHMAFDHAIVDPPGEAIFHGVFVFLDSSGKGLDIMTSFLVMKDASGKDYITVYQC